MQATTGIQGNVEMFIHSLQGMQGPSGPEGKNSGCGCGCGCDCDKNDGCAKSGKVISLVQPNGEESIDLSRSLSDIWDDGINIDIYIDPVLLHICPIEINGNTITITNPTSANCYVVLEYEYFDLNSGGYILVSPRIYFHSDTINDLQSPPSQDIPNA